MMCTESCVSTLSRPTILVIRVHSSRPVLVCHRRSFVLWQQTGGMFPPWSSVRDTVFMGSLCSCVRNRCHHCLQVIAATKKNSNVKQCVLITTPHQNCYGYNLNNNLSYCTGTAYHDCNNFCGLPRLEITAEWNDHSMYEFIDMIILKLQWYNIQAVWLLTEPTRDLRPSSWIYIDWKMDTWEIVIFTALHGMQTRSSNENSVCPFVYQTSTLWQNGKKTCPDFYTIRKIIQPSFPRRRMVGRGDSFYLKFWVNGPRWSEIADFEPIVARSASAVTPSEKSSINTPLIGSPLRAFQWAEDNHRTLPLSPSKCAQRRKTTVFDIKSHFT